MNHPNGRAPQMPVWLRIVLPVSLILNLFLVALIAGHLYRGQSQAGELGALTLARALSNAQASLSPADAAAFGAVMKDNASRFAQEAQQLALARVALERRIEAQPYDKEEVRKAFLNWQTCWNHFMDGFDDPLVEALSQISPEGRRKLIERRRQAQRGSQFP